MITELNAYPAHDVQMILENRLTKWKLFNKIQQDFGTDQGLLK